MAQHGNGVGLKGKLPTFISNFLSGREFNVRVKLNLLTFYIGYFV